MKEISLQIEELEERIAPQAVGVVLGVLGGGIDIANTNIASAASFADANSLSIAGDIAVTISNAEATAIGVQA